MSKQPIELSMLQIELMSKALLHSVVPTRGFTPCQFEHHMRPKFATPILHVIDKFRNYDIFSTYT